MSSLWFASIFFIKVNEVLQCDCQPPHLLYFFFLVSSREHLHWSHILWIAVEKNVGDTCVADMSWGQEKRRAKSTGTSRVRYDEKKRHSMPKQTMLILNCSWSWLCAQERSGISLPILAIAHFQCYEWLHGSAPAGIQNLGGTLIIVINVPSQWVH